MGLERGVGMGVGMGIQGWRRARLWWRRDGVVELLRGEGKGSGAGGWVQWVEGPGPGLSLGLS